MEDKKDIEILSLDEEVIEKPKTRASRYENLLENEDKKKEKPIKEKKASKKERREEEKKLEKILDDDIEENDIEDDKEEDMGKRRKKRKLKKGIGQTIFCLISLLFMLGCFVFYGSRAIKYYKEYHPKTSDGKELLARSIMKNSKIVIEGDGLYRESGNHVFKGKEVNNYIRYSNLTWRIIKISSDNTLEIVLDNPINIMPYDTTNSKFSKSDVSKYLNKEFKQYLDTKKLAKAIVCEDKISDLTKLSCKESNSNNYVKLPDISDLLNSINNDSTYLSDEDDSIWLYNTKDNKNVWSASGHNLVASSTKEFYQVKPVVVLKNTNVLLGGKGTIDNPYKIEKESKKIKFGSYVQLGEDKWVVYGNNKDTLKLTLADLDTSVKARVFSNNKNSYDPNDNGSIASYLNNIYYKDMSYKDKLVKNKWEIGKYKTSYEDTASETVEAYIGLLSASDLKLGMFSDYYYTLTPAEDTMVYIYGHSLLESYVYSYEYYRPAIVIKDNLKIKSGSGTIKDPFILEV